MAFCYFCCRFPTKKSLSILSQSLESPAMGCERICARKSQPVRQESVFRGTVCNVLAVKSTAPFQKVAHLLLFLHLRHYSLRNSACTCTASTLLVKKKIIGYILLLDTHILFTFLFCFWSLYWTNKCSCQQCNHCPVSCTRIFYFPFSVLSAAISFKRASHCLTISLSFNCLPQSRIAR